MFSIPSFAADPMWYAGLIWALTMALAASSYASNFSYRLPRNDRPFGREPYCGDCNHKLIPRDLFPIFSYLLSGGKCRYCKAQVPVTYCVLEILYTLYGGVCYLAFGFGEMFLLMAFFGMLLQISAMMAWDDDHIHTPLAFTLMGVGLIFQLLQGNGLFDGLMGIFYGLFGALILHSAITRKPPQKDVYSLPKWVWLLMASGAWLSLQTGLVFAAVVVLLLVLSTLLVKGKALDSRMSLIQAIGLMVAVWWGVLA